MRITPEQRDQIVKPVRDGLLELVTGSPGLFRDRPDFIAGGGSNDRFSAAVRGLTQLNCRIWAARDKSGYSTRVNQGNAALCGPYLDSLDESVPDGDVGPPFQGGQCPANYRVDGTAVFSCGPSAGTSLNWNSALISGPLTGIVQNTDGELILIGNEAGATVQIFLAVFGGLGLVSRPLNSPACGQLDESRQVHSVAITSIVPIGFTDNCGDPPPDLTPPGVSSPAIPPPPSITIDLPGVGPITVNVDLDDDGDPVFCIEEIDTCFSVDIGGDGDGGVGGGGGTPTTPGDPGGEQNTGDGGTAEDEAPPGEELTGVLVEVLSSPGNANKFDNVSAQVFRGIGYVAMGYPGLLGVDTSAAVVESPQFFHAQQRGLTAYRVRANVGFNLRTTPYYREVTE